MAWLGPGEDPTLDWNYVLGGGDPPTYTEPVFTTHSTATIIEPPPAGYPRVIVHPDRPGAPFILVSPGWYRSPTNEVVAYRTVAEYVLTAQGVDQKKLLQDLGQTGNNTNVLYIAAGVAAVLVLMVMLGGR